MYYKTFLLQDKNIFILKLVKNNNIYFVSTAYLSKLDKRGNKCALKDDGKHIFSKTQCNALEIFSILIV
jgi:hypothetical protein